MFASVKESKKSRRNNVFECAWSDRHSFLRPSRKGRKFAFCELCRANFSIGHGGYKDCKKHVETSKHTSAAQSAGELSTAAMDRPYTASNGKHVTSQSSVSTHDRQDTESSGRAPGDWTFKIPDVPKVPSHEDKDSLPPDFIVKVKVESEFMEYSASHNEGNRNEPKPFQSNVPQTSQETLGKVFVKEEPSDALPKELSSDSQLIQSDPFETQPFQSNVPQTSQVTLAKVSVKKDPSDAPSMEFSSDSLPTQRSIQSKRPSLEAPSGSQPCKKQTSLKKFLKPQQGRLSTQCKDATSCVTTEPQPEDDATAGRLISTGAQGEVDADKIPIEFLSAALHQPTHKKFPHRKFGKQKRAFQSAWFKRFPWLHYSECTDRVLCHLCMKSPLVGCSKKDERFIKKGFCNWKKGLERFNEHQKSARHRIAVQEIFLPSQCGDIGENLSQVHQTDKQENRKIFLEILRNTWYLARQGLPLRGDDDDDDEDGNLFQLIKLRGQTDDHVQRWLKKGTIKYLSKDIQDEQLQIMGLSLLRNIAANVHKSIWYTIIGDEVADTSKKRQLAICIRWINDMLEVEESFTGLYHMETINADMPVAAVRDTLFKLNLSPSNARGQCYDGISNLCVPKRVVCSRMQREAPRATFTHRYGHTLQLAVCVAMREVDELEDVVNAVQEITELRKLSHKRNTVLDQLQHETVPDTSGFRDLYPTRCIVSADSFQTVIDNYEVLRSTWDEYLEDKHLKSDVKAHIISMKIKMETFDFYFGMRVAGLILKLTDNLSKTLQHTAMSASNCQEIAVGTLKTLEKMRSDSDWQLFWACIVQEGEKLCLTDSSPQTRRIRAQSEYPETSKEHYHRMWNRAFDSAKEGIEDRFNQPGYVVLKNLECILAKGANGEPYGAELSTIEEAYKGDFSPKLLTVQLCYIQAQLNEMEEHSQTFSWRDVLLLVRKMTVAQRNIVSEVVKILKLLLLIPATSAVGERSVSVLHRVKTYLASTVAQQRLNHCILLHVHKEITDSINLIDTANEFVNNEKRQRNFGRFSEKDVEHSQLLNS
uniref:TTF-type domain-containing protein n=1 Tax=Eptatretus burgeri TaxID=7764 RepID=A0A8C4QSI2_EPTBU